MEKGWKEIFTTDQEYKAAMAQSILEENNIKSVLLNQHDSAYNIFGEFKIYVDKPFIEKAVELLKDLEN